MATSKKPTATPQTPPVVHAPQEPKALVRAAAPKVAPAQTPKRVHELTFGMTKKDW